MKERPEGQQQPVALPISFQRGQFGPCPTGCPIQRGCPHTATLLSFPSTVREFPPSDMSAGAADKVPLSSAWGIEGLTFPRTLWVAEAAGLLPRPRHSRALLPLPSLALAVGQWPYISGAESKNQTWRGWHLHQESLPHNCHPKATTLPHGHS